MTVSSPDHHHIYVQTMMGNRFTLDESSSTLNKIHHSQNNFSQWLCDFVR